MKLYGGAFLFLSSIRVIWSFTLSQAFSSSVMLENPVSSSFSFLKLWRERLIKILRMIRLPTKKKIEKKI